MRMILSFIFANCLLCVVVSETQAQVSTSTLYSIENGETGFVGLELLSIDGRPLACYGLLQYKATGTPDGKSSFTYLILFKNGDKSSASVQGNGTVITNGGGQIDCDLKMTATVAGRSIQVDYKRDEADDGTMKESLAVGGKPQKTDRARVFLVDLSRPETAIESVKVVPASVPKISNEKQRSRQVQQAIAELKKQSAEIRAFLEN